MVPGEKAKSKKDTQLLPSVNHEEADSIQKGAHILSRTHSHQYVDSKNGPIFSPEASNENFMPAATGQDSRSPLQVQLGVGGVSAAKSLTSDQQQLDDLIFFDQL